MPRQITRTRTRHNRAWSGVQSTVLTTVAAGTKALLGTFAPTTSGDITVLRTVGFIAVRSDQAAADEVQIGSFGMIVVSDRSVVAGASAIPGPFTDISDDGWFLHRMWGQSFEFASAIGFHPAAAMTYDLDSRGKRIVEDGRTVALMIENASGVNGFDVLFGIRMLSEVYG